MGDKILKFTDRNYLSSDMLPETLYTPGYVDDDGDVYVKVGGFDVWIHEDDDGDYEFRIENSWGRYRNVEEVESEPGVTEPVSAQPLPVTTSYAAWLTSHGIVTKEQRKENLVKAMLRIGLDIEGSPGLNMDGTYTSPDGTIFHLDHDNDIRIIRGDKGWWVEAPDYSLEDLRSGLNVVYGD
jgi:hypothetical protein